MNWPGNTSAEERTPRARETEATPAALQVAMIQDTPAVRLGQRLRQARLSRNLTQSEVAANQFSVSYISAVERGQIRPSLGALEKLADRLQVPVADLLRLGDTGPAIAGVGSPRAEAQVRDAQLRIHQGEARAALQALEALRSRTLSQREQALVAWRMAEGYRALQRGAEARAQAQDALAFAERAGDPELRERVRLELGRALSLEHKGQAAIEQFRAARAAIEQGAVLDPLFRLDVLYALGNEHWQAGDAEAAIATLGEAAAAADEALSPKRLGARYWALAQQYRAQGDGRRARLYATRSLAAFEDAANRRLARAAQTRLGRAYAQSGRYEEAIAQLESARERAEAQQDVAGLAEAQASLAGICLRQDRAEEAARAAQHAIELATSVNDPVQQAESQLVLAQVLEARGDHGGAERNFEEAIERLRGADATFPLSDAYAQYSEFLERRGNNKRALEILKQAWQLRERAAATP